MSGDVQLSSQQTEVLIQFQDLTGIEEISECRRLLESHQWNLEAAVQDTLNLREGSPSVFNQPAENQPPALNDSINQRRYQHRIETYRPRGIFGWLFHLTSWPLRNIFSVFINVAVFTVNLFRQDPRRVVTDPVADVVSFVESYDEKYVADHPVFYRGTYSQALSDAKKELKFLLVYLHCDNHQSTDHFCLHTLSNRQVIDFVNQRTLFWACSVDTPEGYRVSQALREYSYPFLAVIVLKQNKMTIVARLEGAIEPDVLLTELQKIMEDNEASLIVARADREERSMNQTLRRQQDDAYLVSLRADQEKERKKMEEKRMKEVEEEKKLRLLNEEEEKIQNLRRTKIELAEKIPEEPSEADPNCVRILIKLPNGSRLERKFLRSHSLKCLYYFIFCNDKSPDNFEVVSNFPRRVLPCVPQDGFEPKSLEEAGLSKSEMLFVNDLDA